VTAAAAAAARRPPADALASLVDGFDDASPQLLERRALLRRTDSKFSIPADHVHELVPRLAGDYAALRVPSGGAIAVYRNLYFDTPDLCCFHDHRRGRRIRHKIRIRHYPDRRISFLEVKTRRNELVVDKQRLPIAFGQDGLGRSERAFLATQVAGLADRLRPQLWIDYRRISLIGTRTHERVTIDVELEVGGLDGVRRGLGPLAVIEVKQAPLSLHTPVMRALLASGLREGSLSKYITAVALLRPEVRRNRLLPALRAGERIRS
jgi:hypothetical protein